MSSGGKAGAIAGMVLGVLVLGGGALYLSGALDGDGPGGETRTVPRDFAENAFLTSEASELMMLESQIRVALGEVDATAVEAALLAELERKVTAGGAGDAIARARPAIAMLAARYFDNVRALIVGARWPASGPQGKPADTWPALAALTLDQARTDFAFEFARDGDLISPLAAASRVAAWTRGDAAATGEDFLRVPKRAEDLLARAIAVNPPAAPQR